MTDLTTPVAATAAVTGISLASVFPGIDGNALIGAFAGATLFVMSAKELNLISRILYLLISLIMGYLGAPEVVAKTPIQATGVAGFLGGLLSITLALALTKRIEASNLGSLLRGLKR